jgi:hypothetical protein
MTWFVEGLTAFVIAAWTMKRKARRGGSATILSGPGRKFALRACLKVGWRAKRRTIKLIMAT